MHTKISFGALRNIQEQQFCLLATFAVWGIIFPFLVKLETCSQQISLL